MSPGDRVKVVKLIDADRGAGNSVCKKPPRSVIGKTGTVQRALTSWDACWVSFGRKRKGEYTGGKYVFAFDELKLVRRAR